MPAKKRALGRGLDSLIAPKNPDPVKSEPDIHRVMQIHVGDIVPNHNQPRFQFLEKELKDLANSIREKGILQPLLVRKQGTGWEIIAGERRFRAAKSLNLKKVPCLVVQVTDSESLEIALIENLQRENLNAMEEAKAYQALIKQFHLSQEEVGKRVGKSRPTITNSIRLLNLPLDIQEDIQEGLLSAGHARAILVLSDAPKQRQLRNLIVSRGLSVRDAEKQAKQMASGKTRKPPRPKIVDSNLRILQEEISMKIGLPAFIKPVSSSSGKLEIHYHSLEDFELLSDYFGIEKQ